jgi:hypothetical protein
MDWIDASPHVVKDLNDAMDYVWEQLSEPLRKEFMETPKDKLWQCHHGLGQSIRNTLGLWEEPKSAVHLYFEQHLGVDHPDDISSIIIDALHAKVCGYEYDLMATVAVFKAYWQERESER